MVGSSLYGLVLVIPLVILLTAFIITTPFQNLIHHMKSVSWISYLILFIYMIFLGGGLEEPGWRGYMLDLSLTKHQLFGSTIMVGLVWVFWHTPLFFIPLLSQKNIPFHLYLINGLFFSLMLSMMYVVSKRNIWLMIVLHAGYNTMLNFYPFTQDQQYTFNDVVLATAVVTSLVTLVYVLMKRKSV